MGNAIINGLNASYLSMAKRSPEIIEISFPELVAIRDFIESKHTLSKMTATKVRRILIEII